MKKSRKRASDFPVYLSRRRIQRRVAELGAEIHRRYGQRELLVIGIMNGAMIFMADLIRHLQMPVVCDSIRVESYGARTRSSGFVRIAQCPRESLRGRDVLLVEDIVDTGLTISEVVKRLRRQAPRSLRLCSLLYKPARKVKNVRVDFLGFTVEDRFVVGYGLDLNGRFRNLPYVSYVKKEAS